ncbi:ribonuclease H2, subunit B [Naematelia encephala]|uniref:Ribonuclease H2, subunit B n=1 Tax=Naematelia encephala TaxID=71784 RepID=A0A1Y2AVX2_9TREE|nr:ribonuclease H2, subunit B [Naematelia encephala]
MEYISILPQDLNFSGEYKYLRLPHPRTGNPQLYLPHGNAILEVQKISGAKRRTWFVGDEKIDAGTILVHYPIDPLFLVIPIILALSTQSGSNTSFQPLSDLVSTASALPAFALDPPFTNLTKGVDYKVGWNDDISYLLSLKTVRRVFKLCCERKAIPSAPPSPPPENGGVLLPPTKGQVYFRPSVELVLRHLKAKMEWMSEESQWYRFDHLVRSLARDGLGVPSANPDLVKSARLKATLEHISHHLPSTITTSLASSYDFTHLQTHLANLSAAAMAASMPPTNSNRNKDAAAKGTKRKAPAASRGVEQLKKVNTASMAKLTNFFKPKDK